MEQFARLLAHTRTAQGVSQSALARRAGTSQSYVSRVEAGGLVPSLAQADRLLNALGHRLDLRLASLPGRVDELERPRDLAMTADERVRASADLYNAIAELQETRA